MTYEVWINNGYSSSEIEADSADEAREIFCQLVRDNLEPEHIETNNLDTEDGEDPE